MPIPLALAIAAMVAGSAMQSAGQAKAERASLNTFNRERNRQRAFEGEQNQRFEDSLESTRRITDADAMAEAAAAREAALTTGIKSAGPAAEGYLPGSSSANPIVAAASEQAGAASDAQTGQLAKALASLGGTTDLMQQNDIRIHRNSQAIDQAGGFKRGSLGVLQAEMDAAKMKGGTLRTLGGLAKTIGQMMAMGAPGKAPIPTTPDVTGIPESFGAWGMGGI